ncbi:MAG TPA: hypothetical protein VMZ27_01780 [Candidatus Saccharimonadales bacterium]|nr:hypothetical protein [Candidatus Saccharimonadales bacterium]
MAQQKAYVFERLKQALIQADEGIPFYRERFLKAGFNPRKDFGKVEDLAGLPVLTKAEVRAHHEEMVDHRFLRTSVVANTSGTTGEPMTMRLGLGYIALDYACMYRFWAQAGYRFRSRYAALRSYVPAAPSEPLWKYNPWQRTLYMSAYHLKPSNSSQYLDALLKFRPEFIRGYASSINVLAEYARPRRKEFDFVRGIFTASETLLDAERETIEGTFGKKLFDWYGMTEPAVVITETSAHDGMEVNWEYGFPEFQEGEDLQNDERRLLATSLHNPVMPFIRYQTDDIVKLAPSEAEPKGLYPKIKGISGRKDECILTPDGGRLPSLNFYSLLQSYTDILKFQFVQRDLTHVTMKVALRPVARDVTRTLSTLHKEVERRLGSEMTIEIQQTEEFERSADGKTPAFKRLFTPDKARACQPEAVSHN